MNKSKTSNLLWNLQVILESLPISSSSHIEFINNWLAQRSNTEPVTLSTAAKHLMHIPSLIVIGIFLALHQPWSSLAPALCHQ